jgi:hypothetical protein
VVWARGGGAATMVITISAPRASTGSLPWCWSRWAAVTACLIVHPSVVCLAGLTGVPLPVASVLVTKISSEGAWQGLGHAAIASRGYFHRQILHKLFVSDSMLLSSASAAAAGVGGVGELPLQSSRSS